MVINSFFLSFCSSIVLHLKRKVVWMHFQLLGTTEMTHRMNSTLNVTYKNGMFVMLVYLCLLCTIYSFTIEKCQPTVMLSGKDLYRISKRIWKWFIFDICWFFFSVHTLLTRHSTALNLLFTFSLGVQWMVKWNKCIRVRLNLSSEWNGNMGWHRNKRFHAQTHTQRLYTTFIDIS